MSPDEILAEAQTKGASSVCLTDVNSTAGCLEFVRQSSTYGIRPILGIDFRRHIKPLYIAIAKNNVGFQEINEHLSKYMKEGAPAIPGQAPQKWENVTVIYPWEAYKTQPQALLPHEWVGIKPHQVRKLHILGADLPKNKLVAQATTTFRHKTDYNTHRLLWAIAENSLLSKLESWQVAEEVDRFFSPAELSEIYKEAPQLLLNAERIAEESEIFFDFSEERMHQNLTSYTGSEAHDFSLISRLCQDGLSYRYGEITEQIRARIATELQTIRSMGFVTYFLLTWDVLRYARSKATFM